LQKPYERVKGIWPYGGLSGIQGNLSIPFLEEGVSAMVSPYPTFQKNGYFIEFLNLNFVLAGFGKFFDFEEEYFLNRSSF